MEDKNMLFKLICLLVISQFILTISFVIALGETKRYINHFCDCQHISEQE